MQDAGSEGRRPLPRPGRCRRIAVAGAPGPVSARSGARSVGRPERWPSREALPGPAKHALISPDSESASFPPDVVRRLSLTQSSRVLVCAAALVDPAAEPGFAQVIDRYRYVSYSSVDQP